MQGGLGSIPTQGTRSHIPQRQSLQAATKTQVEPNKKINSCLKKKKVWKVILRFQAWGAVSEAN